LIIYGMESAAATDERIGPRSRERRYVDALLHLSALSIVAGSIHAIVAPAHLAEAWTHGAFFVALASFQLAWGVAIYVSPSAGGFRIGAAVSLAVIGVWVVSRTLGAPLGPDQWQPEPIGPLDVAATAAEVLIAGMCAAFLVSRRTEPARTALPARFRRLQPLAMLAMTGGLLAMFLGGGHHVH
jgi:hypothetical protein